MFIITGMARLFSGEVKFLPGFLQPLMVIILKYLDRQWVRRFIVKRETTQIVK